MTEQTQTAGTAATGRMCDRKTEEHTRCFMFGHYDSRGGASLIPAHNLIEAFRIYASSFGWSVDEKGELQDEGMRTYFAQNPGQPNLEGKVQTYEEWRLDAIHHLLEEDYMFSCRVIVCDGTFENESDLDERYADDEGAGFRYGLLQYRWQHKNWSDKPEEKADMSKWTNVRSGTARTMVFWKGKKPEVRPEDVGMNYLTGLEVRIVRKDYGEDACGVCWQTEAV